MRFGRVQWGRRCVYARLDDDGIVRPMRQPPWESTAVMPQLLRLEGSQPSRAFDEDAKPVRLLAPCQPSKLVCVGLNYRSHATEMAEAEPTEPLLFLKPPSAVIGPGEDIIWPPMACQVDHEAELGIIIGKTAKNIETAKAREYIFGYTCVNDVTARDLQKKDGQWTRAKSFDTFAPIGPWIETELDDRDVRVECRVNGGVTQRDSSALMLFDVPRLLAFISRVMTLLPGDVVATGTPSGIGPMVPNDVVEVEVGGVGVLRNRLVSGRI